MGVLHTYNANSDLPFLSLNIPTLSARGGVALVDGMFIEMSSGFILTGAPLAGGAPVSGYPMR